MIRRTNILAGILAGLTLSAGFITLPVSAQTVPAYVAAAVKDPSRPAADVQRDADRKPADSLAASGVKPGDTVLELLPGGGYYTRLLSKVVGPRGHVYSLVPDSMIARRPTAGDAIKTIAAEPGYSNVSLVGGPDAAPAAPVPVDMVWTSDNYHDMHNPAGARDMVAYDKAILAALKPGGSYIVIDHAAAAGTGFTQTGTLHRIDPDAVKTEVMQAGFAFAGSSDALMRANDDRTTHSSDEDSQFIFRFRKP